MFDNSVEWSEMNGELKTCICSSKMFITGRCSKLERENGIKKLCQDQKTARIN